MTPKMFVLLYGNPVDGFQCMGPFKDTDRKKVTQNATHALGGDWWFVPLVTTDADGIDKYLMKHDA